MIISIDSCLLIMYNNNMIKIYITLTLFLTLGLDAKMLADPIKTMKYTFGANTEVTKKNVLLNKSQLISIEKSAKVKLRSKIFRVFTATLNKKKIAYGILLSRQVRSKNVVVLYMLNMDTTLNSIEIIAFNEPLEYITPPKWNSLFKGVSSQRDTHVLKGIPNITGATLSARAIKDGTRIVFAFYNEMLREK